MHRVLPVFLCLILGGQYAPAAVSATAQPDLNFKIYNSDHQKAAEEKPVEDTLSEPATDAAQTTSASVAEKVAKPGAKNSADGASDGSSGQRAAKLDSLGDAGVSDSDNDKGKVLQGYVRVVPSGTKIPIIMDTAIDSDTSQEGDEFTARTGEDLDIDGLTVVPAGSTIKGRIAQLNLPRRMDRSGSVALKFDTVTTPDSRQIPLVATLVARGGVVHARRGIKDIAIDTAAVGLPTLAGLGIGLIAGNASSSSSIGAGGGALIGAGIGVAVGMAILLSKKGKKVDVRPGDEMKIELAEDLRMPI